MTYENLCQAVISFRVMQPTKPLHLHVSSLDAASLEFIDGGEYQVEGENVIVHVDDELPPNTAALGMNDLRGSVVEYEEPLTSGVSIGPRVPAKEVQC